MNLIIDVGNTFVKLAVFKGDLLTHKASFGSDAILNHVHALKAKYPIKQAIISSVGHLKQSDIEAISQLFNTVVLNANTPYPFTNLYATPKTLGVDRLALVAAAVKHYANKNVLIIDAGTCITYDFIDSNKAYLGGAISLGVNMRYKALNNLTANLPLLGKEIPQNIIGNSTEQAIHSGVVYGIINEIEGAIETYRLKYLDLTVILTGGDANFLSKQLKSIIFAHSNFLLEGLNYILQLNVKE